MSLHLKYLKQTTEGIECIPAMLTFVAGIIAFILHLPPTQIGLIVFSSGLVGLLMLMNVSGFHVIPGLVSCATLFSYFHSFGIYSVIVIITGMLLGSWEEVLAFYIAKITLFPVLQIITFWQASHYKKLTGYSFVGPEINFFNAYRIYALRIGVSTNIDLSDEEILNEYWKATFEKFANEWPELVKRFTLN